MEKPLIGFLAHMLLWSLMFPAVQWPWCLWDSTLGLSLRRKAHCQNLNLGRPNSLCKPVPGWMSELGMEKKTQPFPSYEVAQVLSSSFSQAERETKPTQKQLGRGREAEGLLTSLGVCLNVNQQVVFCCAASVKPIFHPSEPKLF